MAEEENENIAIHYIDKTVIRVGREKKNTIGSLFIFLVEFRKMLPISVRM